MLTVGYFSLVIQRNRNNLSCQRVIEASYYNIIFVNQKLSLQLIVICQIMAVDKC